MHWRLLLFNFFELIFQCHPNLTLTLTNDNISNCREKWLHPWQKQNNVLRSSRRKVTQECFYWTTEMETLYYREDHYVNPDLLVDHKSSLGRLRPVIHPVPWLLYRTAIHNSKRERKASSHVAHKDLTLVYHNPTIPNPGVTRKSRFQHQQLISDHET